MDLQLALICLLTFVIHVVGTLAYSVRIAGVRTQRVAISFALFNDDVIEGKTSEPAFRKTVVWLTGSRLAGTLIAQLLLLPAALLIVRVAQWL